MAPKVFITGTTGYIGGDALAALHQAHPEYEYSLLVRNSDSGAKVAAAYPKVRLVYGSLDDASLLESEASNANIVLHTADASDHAVAANAIAAGLARSHTATAPGFWIHLSGTGILCWSDTRKNRFGEAPDTPPYDDLDRVGELTSLPDDAFHRDVDKIVLAAGSAAVKTAIVCPPTIYGIGRGPGNQQSRQLNGLIRASFKQGFVPVLGRGLSEWDTVHIHDLSDLLVLLVEKAASWTDAQSSEDAEIWGEKGYYLAENGHLVWGEVSNSVANDAAAKGLLQKVETKQVSKDEAFELGGFEAVTWGLNSRGLSKRAKKYLHWNPHRPDIHAAVGEIIDAEAMAAGLSKGHAKKVAEASK